MRAAIFDLDGTLVDNMGTHADAWVTLSKRLGLDIPRERYLLELAGRKNEEIIPLLQPLADAAALEQLAEEKETLYRSIYKERMAPMAGLLALFKELHAACIPLAVASAAPLGNRALVLDGLGLRRHFKAVIGAEHAARGKPHPDIFLAAAAALKVEPNECIAFEDAVLGVQAAVAAGMPTVGLTTSQTPEALLAAGARWTLTDFTSLPADLRGLLSLPV